MKTLLSSLGLLALLAGMALAEAPATPAAPPAPPPEIKKTVDAFNGNWTLEGTLTGIPGTKGPVKVKETLVCQKAVAGMAVLCRGKGSAEGMGAMEDAFLITYVAAEKALHFVGADSMGEFHDHKCTWKDDKNMACEPFAAPNGSVDLVMTFADAKHATATETSTGKDGTKVVFEGKFHK